MTILRMKRPHSPSNIGISNYKRQRLIEDLQNLTISDTPSLRSVQNIKIPKNDAVNCLVMPSAVKDQVWDMVKNNGRSNAPKDRIYDKIWETIRDSNLQVIKWYSGAELLYKTWLVWFRKQHLHMFEHNNNYMEVDENAEADQEEMYGYEPMVIDTDY